MGSTKSQAKALSIIPHVTGTMSLIGSCSILSDILMSDGQGKLTRPYHRILLGISTVDALTSIALALSTLPIPAGTEGVYNARGNTQTCTVQGFFVQLNVLSYFYNVILSAYYLLLGKYRMLDAEIARYEKWMHAVAITLGLGFAILGLPLNLYNNANLWCWVAAYPSNCEDASGEPGPVPCERGQSAWLFRWLIFYGPTWLAVLAVVAMMVMLTRSVSSDEKEMVRLQIEMRRRSEQEENGDRPPPIETNRYERSKLICGQAGFYVIVFLVAIGFASMNRLYQLITGQSSFVLLLGHSIFGPLQGFFNMLVYRHGKITA